MRGYLKDPTKIRLVHRGGNVPRLPPPRRRRAARTSNRLADEDDTYGQTGLDRTRTQPRRPHVSTRRPSNRARLQPRDRGRRRRHAAAGATPLPLPRRRALHLGHVELLAGVRHVAAGSRAAAAIVSRPHRRSTPPGLIGKTCNGMTITRRERRRLDPAAAAPQGVRKSDQDASVWNWTIDSSNPLAPVYLGEPEDGAVAGPAEHRPEPSGHADHRPRTGRHRLDGADRPVICSTRSTGDRPARSCVRTSATGLRSPRTGTPVRRSSARTGNSTVHRTGGRPVRFP